MDNTHYYTIELLGWHLGYFKSGEDLLKRVKDRIENSFGEVIIDEDRFNAEIDEVDKTGLSYGFGAFLVEKGWEANVDLGITKRPPVY